MDFDVWFEHFAFTIYKADQFKIDIINGNNHIQ